MVSSQRDLFEIKSDYMCPAAAGGTSEESFYLYRIDAGDFSRVKKCLVVK